MNILILGGSGFLGEHLLSQLYNKKKNILVISKSNKIKQKNIKHILLDLNNVKKFYSIIENFKPDICIDLSWSGIPDYSRSNNLKNYNIKKKIFDALIRLKCKKILSIGSCWEYGDLKGSLIENKKTKNLSNFANYKIKCLNYLKKCCKQNKTKFIWARVFFVYGPKNKKTSLLPSFYRAIINKKNFELKNKIIGNDYIYVTDVTKAIITLSLENLSSGVYNIGSGKLTANIDFCNKIYKKMYNEKYFNIKYKNYEGSFANIEKIKNKTNWKPMISLKKGIELTLNSFK